MRSLRLVLFAVVALLTLLVAVPAPTAHAAPRSKWISAVVPLRPRQLGGTAMVPLTAPSSEHPLGTVAIFGQNVPDVGQDGGESNLTLMAIAWDLAAQKVIATKPIARLPLQQSVVSAVRDGARILLIAGGPEFGWDSHESVTLFTVDETLDVVSREVLGVGSMPSIALADRWIVTGFFEPRVPEGTLPTKLAFHAQVLDRATHAVVDARVFQGTTWLFPAPQTWLSLNAFAVHGADVYVSVPGEAEVTIVKATLPSLTPVKTRVLDGFGVALGCSAIHVVGENLAVVTPVGWRLLTFQLDLVPRVFHQVGQAMAWNPKRATLLSSLTQGKALPWISLDVDEDCMVPLWAWDRPIALCTGSAEEDATYAPKGPMRLVRLR